MKWTGKVSLRCLTRGELHPGADLVDHGRVAEEEEAEAHDGADHQQHGRADEEHGGAEGCRGNGVEVEDGPFTDELRGKRVADAVVEETEVAGLWRVDAVAYPERLDEDHHDDDGETDGEYRPQDADGPRIPHVSRVVDLGGLVGRQQVAHLRRDTESREDSKCKTRSMTKLPKTENTDVTFYSNSFFT